MNPEEHGRTIITIAKSLKALAADEARIVRHFSATKMAGNAGLFASSIRGYAAEGSALDQRRLRVLYNDAGLDDLSFKHYIKPWLTRNNLAFLIENERGEESLVATILTYDAILRAVVELFEFLDGASEEALACHDLVHLASELPRTVGSMRQRLSTMYDEETAILAIGLCRGLRFVSFSKKSATSESATNEAVIYSDRVWKNLSQKVAEALPNLTPDESAALDVFIEDVKNHQGYPEPALRNFAIANNAENVLDFAIGVGLITRTGIRTPNGMRQFLTTPHFYAEVEEKFGEDVCDRVKVFLNSIRHGQYFSLWSRGQIGDPSALLRALLNNGAVGPATAIGEDYTMAERAGVVRVERSHKPGQFNMVLVQEDVVRKTIEVVERKAITPVSRNLRLSDVRDKGEFVSIPENRARLADVPGEMKEAEEEFLNTLREF